MRISQQWKVELLFRYQNSKNTFNRYEGCLVKITTPESPVFIRSFRIPLFHTAVFFVSMYQSLYFFERPIYKRNFILYNSTYKQTAVVYFLESKRSTELFSGRSQESFFPTFNKCFRRNLIITQGVLQKGVMYTIEQKNPCDS